MPSYGQRKDGSWWVRWSITDPDTHRRRQPTRSGFRTKREAERWWAREVASQDPAIAGHEKPLMLYARDWLRGRQHQIRPATYMSYEQMLRDHVEPYLGEKAIASITATDLRSWHQQLRDKQLAPGTIHRVHTLLGQILKEAHLDGYIRSNPASRTRPAVPDNDRRLYLTPEQLQTLLSGAPDDVYGLLFQTAGYTAMRLGELLALRWENVDWERSAIRVVETQTRRAPNDWITGPPKSRAGYRTIHIPSQLRQALRDHRTTQLEIRLQLGSTWQDHDLVFANMRGRPLDRGTIRSKLSQLCRRLDLPVITMHGLRRSAATWMASLGVHPRVIQERLGHESIETTMRIYAAVSADMDRAAAEQMERVLQDRA